MPEIQLLALAPADALGGNFYAIGTVELTVPDIKPTLCMEVHYELETAEGETIEARINNTIHNLAEK